MHKFLQNLLLLLISLTVSLLIAELGASFLPPPIDGPENPAEVCDSATGWRGRPHFASTVDTAGYVHDLQLNSRGLHDQAHAFDKSADSQRILMLGDSFVQGIQVREAETNHQVLEDLLNADQPDPPTTVISGGVGGWGTGQQLQFYRSEGRNYQPDLVLLMVYLGNDVKDNLPGRGITVNGYNCYAPYFTRAKPSAPQINPVAWLYAPGLSPATNNPWPAQKQVNNLMGWLYRYSHLYAQLEPLLAPAQLEASVLDFYIGNNEVFDEGLAVMRGTINQLAREVEADGAEFAVVLISPMALLEFAQLSDEAREVIYQELPAMRRAEEIPPPNEAIAEMLQADGLTVIDLFPAFLAEANPSGDNLYFKVDKHWNSAGNRLAAETIFTWLMSQDSKSIETP